MIERPSLRQLEYFVVLAEELSFHRAASIAGVTQPGLSSQIAQLENLLGSRLFERSSRRVLLTAAGEELLPHARAVLGATDALVDQARAAQDPMTGQLHLGVIPTVAPYLLPACLPEVRRRWPALRLLIHEDKTENLLARLNAGSLDVLVLDIDVPLGDCAVLPLFEDPFLLVVPRAHPLGRRKRVKESDLTGEDVLLLEDGHCMRAHTLSLCAMAGAAETTNFRASSLPTLVQTVAGGLGVTLLPNLAVPTEVRAEDNLAIVRFNAPQPKRTIGLAWRKTSARSATFETLAKVLKPRATP